MVESGSLENCFGRKPNLGSNPSPTAKYMSTSSSDTEIVRALVRSVHIPDLQVLEVRADTGLKDVPDAAFGVAVLVRVLGRIPDTVSGLKEVYRILESRGAVVVVDDPQRFPPEQLRTLFLSRGFDVETLFLAGRGTVVLAAYKDSSCLSGQRRYDDLTVIIPVLNEELAIGKVIKDLCHGYPGVRVIIADDGSTDGTVETVRSLQRQYPGVALLSRPPQAVKGLTASVLDAISRVATTFFAVMDGDGQHDARHVEKLYNHLRHGTELVVATRVSVKGWPWHRKCISVLGNRLGRNVLRGRCFVPRDVLSGFFGARTEVWRAQSAGKEKMFFPRGYKVLFDFLRLCDPRMEVSEAYYSFDARVHGVSKAGWGIYWQYARSLFPFRILGNRQ